MLQQVRVVLLIDVHPWRGARMSLSAGCRICLERDLAFPKFIASLFHRSKQCGPVVNITCEDVSHHIAGQLGHQKIEFSWGIAHLVCKSRPIKIIGIPRFRKQSSGVTAKR